jgi:hypothetical protein
MSRFFAAAGAAAAVLIAGPALADPASGLVPEQGKAAPCCGDTVGFTAEAPKDPAEAEPVRLLHTPFAAIRSSLPEPASWGLMIIGFGGMGAILRNNRRATARP